FFFSSRRRHTRFSRDWSSDVCSSDLWKTIDQNGNRIQQVETISGQQYVTGVAPEILSEINKNASMWIPISGTGAWYPTSWAMERSEERRVGKECICGWRWNY